MKSARIAFLVASGLGACIAMACSSSSSSAPPGSLVDASGSDSGSGTVGDEGSTDSPGGLLGGGALHLSTAKTLSTFVAAFTGPGPGGLTPGCTIEPIGACKLLACASLDAAPPMTTPPPQLSAGTITATGGLIQGAGLVLTPDSEAKYPGLSGPGILWTGGETLTFAASGGTVPAFSKTAIAPTFGLSIATPVMTSGTVLNVPRSSDFLIQWQVGSAPAVGHLDVLIGSTASVGSRSLTCSFDVASLSGTIPSATLSRLEAGIGTLTLGVSASTATSVGDYLLNITLATPVTASGDDFTFAALEFQ